MQWCKPSNKHVKPSHLNNLVDWPNPRVCAGDIIQPARVTVVTLHAGLHSADYPEVSGHQGGIHGLVYKFVSWLGGERRFMRNMGMDDWGWGWLHSLRWSDDLLLRAETIRWYSKKMLSQFLCILVCSEDYIYDFKVNLLQTKILVWKHRFEQMQTLSYIT